MTPTLAQRQAQQLRPTNQTHIMYQTWRDLLFLHWAVPADIIQATLPAGLTVDTYNGSAWLGVVPFFMDNIRPRFLPSVPGISWFLELNLRTYVYDKNGTPGVWFYSLDCNQALAVWTARTFFKLPYFNAQMSAERSTDHFIDYRATRRGHAQQATRLRYRPLPNAPLTTAQPNTLEFFLVERYILFAETHGGLASGQVHHTPYQFSAAEVSHWDANIPALAKFPPFERPPDSALFSPGVRVDIFPLVTLS